jgi:peptide chain release factor 1
MDESFARRLTEIEDAFQAVENMLGDPEVLADSDQLAELGKKHSDLKDVVADIRRWREAQSDLAEAKEMSSDPDMAQMAKELTAEIVRLEASIKVALTPTDPNDARDVLVEIRSSGATRRRSGLGTFCGCMRNTQRDSASRPRRSSHRRMRLGALTR